MTGFPSGNAAAQVEFAQPDLVDDLAEVLANLVTRVEDLEERPLLLQAAALRAQAALYRYRAERRP